MDEPPVRALPLVRRHYFVCFTGRPRRPTNRLRRARRRPNDHLLLCNVLFNSVSHLQTTLLLRHGCRPELHCGQQQL